MKNHQSHILLCTVLGCALATVSAAQDKHGRQGGPPPAGEPAQAGVYTTVSGAISQLNYDRDGEADGLLLNNNTLVHLPPPAAPRIGTSVHVGDNVQIAGYAQTSPAGMQTVEAQDLKDRTSGTKFALPQPGAAAPYSGSGRIQQLNYGRDGSIDGFILDNGILATMPPFGAANPSFVRAGATVAYTGYARSTVSGKTVVDVQTLTANGQTLTLGPAGPGRGPGARPGAPPPPPPGPAPAGGSGEQPAPPPPPQPPQL